jgi:HAD superfamily hydrolase (TIGR01450 family)
MTGEGAPSLREALAAVKVIALDLDGVVYHGNALIPGADVAIRTLRERGYAIRFLTNASGLTGEHIAAKLVSLGVPAACSDISSSAAAVALRIGTLGERVKTVHVCGTGALAGMVESVGVRLVDDAPADALVVGFDTDFTYAKLAVALRCTTAATVFIAANLDVTYPSAGGILKPACGPLVAAVACAIRRPPDYIAGKPSVTMLDMVCASLSVTNREVLVGGDPPESDIAMARNFHALSVLCATAPLAGDASPAPDYVIPSLRHLPALLGTVS